MFGMACVSTFALGARAQVLDRIEREAGRDDEVELVLRFSVPVLYQRHAPVGSGAELRIYLRVIGVDVSGMAREYLRVPALSGLPPARVSFPESDGSLLVVFDRRTAYRITQARDSRSISIFVPELRSLPPPGPAGTSSNVPGAGGSAQ